MVPALAAALGVFAAAALVLVAAVGRRSRDLRRSHTEVEQLSARLSESAARAEQAEQEKRAADVRSAGAERRSRSAESKAMDAERRAGEAERRLAEARRRGSEPDAAAWEAEHLRMEREWLDVVGPGVDAPVAWDASVGAVVATELAVIREVMGTPSELQIGERGPAPAPAALRIVVEMLRRLARSGEEMEVVVAPDGVTVTQLTPADEALPDLSPLVGVAGQAGLDLSFSVTDGRSEARLEWGGEDYGPM